MPGRGGPRRLPAQRADRGRRVRDAQELLARRDGLAAYGAAGGGYDETRVRGSWLALLLVLGVAVAVVHAAAAISTAVAAAPAASPVRTRRPIGIARIAALTCVEGQNSLTVLNN